MAKPRSVDLSNPFLDNLEGVSELLLVRHGEQQYVRDMTIADGVNPPLSPLGEQQAAAVRQWLQSEARRCELLWGHLPRLAPRQLYELVLQTNR